MDTTVATPDTKKWDILLKAASVLCTAVIIPGVGWAWNIHNEIADLSTKVALLRSEIDNDRKGSVTIVEEIRALRISVDSLRTDLLQRITRVETQLDKGK